MRDDKTTTNAEFENGTDTCPSPHLRIVRLPFHEAERLRGAQEWQDEIAELYNNEMGKFAPSLQTYRVMEELGMLRCVAVLTDDNELAGGAMILVNYSSHMSVPFVVIDVLYMRKKYRNSPFGLKLWAEVEHVVKDEGALGYGLNTIPGSTYDKLCEKKGFLLVRNTYWRSL